MLDFFLRAGIPIRRLCGTDLRSSSTGAKRPQWGRFVEETTFNSKIFVGGWRIAGPLIERLRAFCLDNYADE